jgi:RNA polymerase subunit RPABC4/transcription elongation factor Spt4
MDYRNLDLHLSYHTNSRSVERFRVWVESPVLDMPEDDAVDVRMPKGLRDKLRALEGRSLTAAEIRTLGEIMGQMMFPESLQDLVSDNLNAIENDQGLRIRLKLGGPGLSDLPWEYAYLPDLEPGYVALNGRISLVRYEQIKGAKTDLLPLGEDSLRLAALFADPKLSIDYNELHLEVEEANLRDTLSRVAGLTAEFQTRATVDALNRALAARPHILHFAGHGKFEKDMGAKPKSYEGKGYLVLLDDDQKAREFEVDKFVANLQGCGVRLVVLGACESARRDGQNAWTGISPALSRIGIPAIIGMQYGILNANATTFSKHFYDTLALGESIDWAMNRARLAIYNKPEDLYWRDWGVPVLYLRMKPEETNAVIFPRLARAQGITPPRRDIGVTSSVTSTYACLNCGGAVRSADKFCPGCGQPLQWCAQCNALVPANANFCPSCGAPVPHV